MHPFQEPVSASYQSCDHRSLKEADPDDAGKGSVLLMSHTNRNEPLGLRNAPARTSASSLPSPFPPGYAPASAKLAVQRRHSALSNKEKKRTADGKMILVPQPDDSLNDPLNWPSWRRDVALLSLGFYCMLGGGMTPVLAAGFQNVADSYHVTVPRVALTTGLYMLGLGLGSVVFSPTAILWGKRPVYLVGILLFILSSIWCALSPNYPSLVIARIFMGVAVSPVECLPSATIAEIFYLHERAYRLGIYTLLLLSGKNLIPLVSAAIIQGLSWQWVFWYAILLVLCHTRILTSIRIVAIVVGLCFAMVFLFVPETFWDRTPHAKHRKSNFASLSKIFHHHPHEEKSTTNIGGDASSDLRKIAIGNAAGSTAARHTTIAERRQQSQVLRVGFADEGSKSETMDSEHALSSQNDGRIGDRLSMEMPRPLSPASHTFAANVAPRGEGPATPGLHNFNSPFYIVHEKHDTDYVRNEHIGNDALPKTPRSIGAESHATVNDDAVGGLHYTTHLRTQPPKTYMQTLKPWNGKLRNEHWFKVALRPFILFAYPSILWSALVYSLSIGWLIVLSESVSTIFKNRTTYNFTSLQTGLVYISPFIGGILGTAVAGKVSDLIVRFMSRRNGGVYEPEFRLIMAIPITISTCIGLMGFGWSAQERDNFMVPTIFFGIISFGCSLGSTTSITFAVDSYRQYAGEALVTLNFSKSMFKLQI